jgi:glycosyltransferase involved in cell wall biosynthesis
MGKPNMKILSFLNISNLSNLEADSGFVFQRTLLEYLAKNGHDVWLVGSKGISSLLKNINCIEIDFTDSKYGVRFGINWLELRAKLNNIANKIDILFVNQSELTIPLSVLLTEIIGKRIPTITYFHYIAVQELDTNNNCRYDESLNINGIAPYIWQRQVESALYSDHNIIGSDFGYNLFLKASGKSDILRNKFSIISPPVADVSLDNDCNSDYDNLIPCIIYNHRLYNHYGGRLVFEWLEEISENINFNVVVTDPTANRSMTRKSLDTSVTNIKHYLSKLNFVEISHFPTQEEYYRKLQYIYFGIAPFRTGALWSMSTADVMASSKPVIAQNKEVFREIIKDSDLLFDSKEDFQYIVQRLLLDSKFRKQKGFLSKQQTEHLKPCNIAKQFETVFLKFGDYHEPQ